MLYTGSQNEDITADNITDHSVRVQYNTCFYYACFIFMCEDTVYVLFVYGMSCIAQFCASYD